MMLLQFKWGFRFLSTFLKPRQPPRAIGAFTNTTCGKNWQYTPCPYPWPQRLCPLWCQGSEQAKFKTIFSCLEPNSICHLYFSSRNPQCSASIPSFLLVTNVPCGDIYGKDFVLLGHTWEGKQDRRTVLGHPIQDKDQQWCKFLILTFSKSPCKLISIKSGLKVS